MKVINIEIPYNFEEMAAKNSDVDVFVTMEDGFIYTLTFATPKHFESVMEDEKMDYYGIAQPKFIVNRLTREIIEKAVKAYAEYNDGYWVNLHYFGGCVGSLGIEKKVFERLKKKQIQKKKKFRELIKLDDFMEEWKKLRNALTLKGVDQVNGSSPLKELEKFEEFFNELIKLKNDEFLNEDGLDESDNS